MDLVGYLLGNRYQIIEKIGDGGMATVYKAKCNVLNRYVAIKVLKEEFVNDVDFTKKFATEAQAAASLSHPNIVSIYDVGKEGNINYIVMELVEGKTLKQIIKEEGKLYWKKACEIAYEIAQGIAHAHKNHIIHRDIKPHNIIVTPDMKIKVTDFGIAKAASSGTITMSGDAIGSVHYFSPEQAKGGVTTEKSDIYSLGVVLYEMLTGILPFNGDSPVSIALKHVQEIPKMPSDIEITVPYSVNNIVMKAMQKDPNLRYQNISEMALDLNFALHDPTQNHAEIKNYENFATQKIDLAKLHEQTEYKPNNDRQEQINRLAKNTNNNILNVDALKDKSNSSVKIKHKKRRTMRAAILVAIILVLFCGAIFAGLYISGFIGRAPDVKVISVTGMTVEEAESALKKIGLTLQIDSEINDNEVPINTIISQSPKEPMTIKQGNSVNVVVSKGPTEVTVPDLTDYLLDDAIFELDKIGLKYEQHDETSLEVDKGKVIRQSPEKNQTVKSESIVIIYVSSGLGDGKVKMPKLVEMTEDDAKLKILDNNLVLKEPITYKSDKTKPNNVVLSQSIPIDSIINEGTEISIEVNKISVETDSPISNTSIKYQDNNVVIDLSEMTSDSLNVKVLNDSKKILYDKTVYKSNKTVKISINDTTTKYIEVYINSNIAARFSI